jgi:hypothetical protein
LIAEVRLGVLSELVIALKSEAHAVAECDSPSRDWHGVVWKGLDPITLASLWSILEGEELDVDNVVSRSSRIQLAVEDSNDGPWVFAIPEAMRDSLAELAAECEDKIEGVARAWAATDELKDWDYSDVAELLQDVIDLADGARLERKDLLLWISL